MQEKAVWKRCPSKKKKT